MSDDKDNRTKKEIDLDIEKRKIEIEKLKVEVETKQVELQRKHLDAKRSEIETTRLIEDEEKRKNSDAENYVYRFNGSVEKASVTKCRQKLTSWMRKHSGDRSKHTLEIVFSSPGGEIISGFELFDFIQDLRSRGYKITTGSLGYAASMAGILLQAGEKRWIGHQSWMMIHRAAFLAVGKTFEVEDEVEFIKRVEDRILDIFVARSTLTKQKIKRTWDRKDWWLSSDECLELGLVDEIRGKLPEMEES